MKPSEIKILIVDDENDILEFLSYNLKKEGYQIYTASNGKQAIKTAKNIFPHLIILDVMMPQMDGIEACEQLRQVSGLEKSIIAFLTARAEDYSQIAGFEAGGDDYISKPIKPKVLVSRVKALLKRYGNAGIDSSKTELHVFEYGDLIIDIEKHLVTIGEKSLILPRKEYNLLLLLTSKPSKVFTRDEIFNQVWGSDIYVGDRTIDVYIRKLREKIGDTKIVTIKGVGYKFEPQLVAS